MKKGGKCLTFAAKQVEDKWKKEELIPVSLHSLGCWQYSRLETEVRPGHPWCMGSKLRNAKTKRKTCKPKKGKHVKHETTSNTKLRSIQFTRHTNI